MKMNLRFEDLHIGMKVIDESDIGTVIECDDIHNVQVEFKNEDGIKKGMGLYCLDENCDQYSPLFN